MTDTLALPAEIQSAIDLLLPLLRRFARSGYGIALGGAHAKGVSDAASDLDLYLFANVVLPNELRAKLAAEHDPRIHDVYTWGGESPFQQAGTDFMLEELKVEVWLRAAHVITGALNEAQAGVVKRELVTWTTTGFYNHCALADIHTMVVLEDPNGLLTGWQRRVAEYPDKLRDAIIAQHLAAARFWPHNFHYATAVERCDLIYTTGIVQQVLHNLIQVLFALNRVYFSGDKKLAQALKKLDRSPESFAERVEALMFPGEPATVELLRAQREELQRLVDEVGELVAADD